MEIAALCAVILAIGLVSGYEWGRRNENKRREALMMLDDYDLNNSINANGQQRKTVTVCGYEWELRQP